VSGVILVASENAMEHPRVESKVHCARSPV
jgi:hypothetical protein